MTTQILTDHVVWLKSGVFTANGNKYSTTVNTTADINQADAPTLQAMGVAMIVARSGPTSARPQVGNTDISGQAGTYAIPVYMIFYDTSISQIIKCDPAGVWHRVDTGAVV